MTAGTRCTLDSCVYDQGDYSLCGAGTVKADGVRVGEKRF